MKKQNQNKLFDITFKQKMKRIFYPKDAKEIMSITIHIFLQLFFAAIIAQINILLFSWYDGKNYYAVINKVTVLFTTFEFMPSLIASGVLVVAGNLYGQNRQKEIPIVVSTGLLINGLICLFVVGILEGTNPYLLRFLGADDSSINSDMFFQKHEIVFAVKYFRIQIITLFIMSFAQVYIAALQVIKKQKHVMIGAIASNVVDAFIVASCLYWWKVDPIWTALSIPIASLLQMIYMAIMNYIYIGINKVKMENQKYAWFSAIFAKGIIRIGVPMTAEMALWYLCNFLTNGAIAALHSPDKTTTDLFIDLNRTINAIDQYSYTFLQAIATTTSIMVAKKIGEQDKEGAYEAALNCWRISVYAQAILSTLVLILINPLLMAFNTDAELINKYGYILWVLVMLKILGDTVNLSLLRALWTVGDLWKPLAISIVTMLIGMVGLPWMVVWLWNGDTGYGLVIIFAMLTLDPLVRSIIYIKMWLSKKWMKKVINIE